MNLEPGGHELLRDSRMVLGLPCGDGALLDELRERRVPAVGIDDDAAAVARCRQRGHVAYAVSWRGLAHRQRFDGVLVDATAPGVLLDGEAGTLLDRLDRLLLPGGVIVLHRGEGVDLDGGRMPPGLARIPGPAGLLVLRKAGVRPPPACGLVVGPYADLFAGCRQVVEVGAGVGRFLDALHVRGIGCAGIEQDPGLAAAARGRGHAVDQDWRGHLRPESCDGVFAGNVVEALDAHEVARLLAVCRHALRPGGRMLVRVARSAAVVQDVRELAATGGFPVCRSGTAPGDGTDCFLLLLAGEAPAPPRADLDGLRLPAAGLAINQPQGSLFDLERFERRVHSQGGEDGVLAAIFARVGATDRSYVEFGCGDGVQCNTAHLRRQGWRGLLMDGVAAPGAPDAEIHAAWITAENINALLDVHGVPQEPDLMSVDLDGNDWWVWRAITRRPRVVVVEYNANLGADEALTIPYDPQHRWDGSDYYGASLPALDRLGRSKGYTLVYCNTAGVNAFFVRDDLLGGEAPRDVRAIWRPPNYWYRRARQFPDLARPWVAL